MCFVQSFYHGFLHYVSSYSIIDLYICLVKKIAIFASGAGSNALTIIKKFSHHKQVQVALIVSNRSDAGVLTIAVQNTIPSLIIDKEKFFRGNAYTNELTEAGISLIVLAGFLWKIPAH